MLAGNFKIGALADGNVATYEETFLGPKRVHDMPAFPPFSSYFGEDGMELAAERSEHDVALARWREELAHILTRRRGLEVPFETYESTVTTAVRQCNWHRTGVESLAPATPTGARV